MKNMGIEKFFIRENCIITNKYKYTFIGGLCINKFCYRLLIKAYKGEGEHEGDISMAIC